MARCERNLMSGLRPLEADRPTDVSGPDDTDPHWGLRRPTRAESFRKKRGRKNQTRRGGSHPSKKITT